MTYHHSAVDISVTNIFDKQTVNMCLLDWLILQTTYRDQIWPSPLWVQHTLHSAGSSQCTTVIPNK